MPNIIQVQKTRVQEKEEFGEGVELDYDNRLEYHYFSNSRRLFKSGDIQVEQADEQLGVLARGTAKDKY